MRPRLEIVLWVAGYCLIVYAVWASLQEPAPVPVPDIRADAANFVGDIEAWLRSGN